MYNGSSTGLVISAVAAPLSSVPLTYLPRAKPTEYCAVTLFDEMVTRLPEFAVAVTVPPFSVSPPDMASVSSVPPRDS